MRPNCLKRDACEASNGRNAGTHCRRCTASALTRRPDHAARHRAGIAAFHADRERSANHRAAALRNIAEYRQRPGVDAILRERGREIAAISKRPEHLQKLRETGPTRGRKRTETVLGWCPEEYRDEYRWLVKTKHLPAVEARQIIEAMVAENSAEAVARRAISEIDRQQRLRAAREKAQAY